MRILFLIVLIDLIGFGIVIPILPFAAPRFGAGSFDIALLLMVYSVCGALASPLWGRLSDRWGRKKVLLLCLGGGLCGYLLLGFSRELWMLYVARVVAGCFAGNFGVAAAMASDMSTPQNRGRAMGILGSAFGLGMVVGPSLGGLLAGPQANLLPPALVAASMSLLAIVAGAILLKDVAAPQTATAAAAPPPSLHRLLTQTGNLGVVLQCFVITSAISTVSYVFPLVVGHDLHWGPRQVGIIFGVQGLAMAALQAGLAGRLIQRFGELPLLRVALLLMVGGFVLASAMHNAVGILLAFFMAVTGASCSTPVLNTLLSKRTPFALRGRMLGTSSAASAWGRVFGPLCAGFVLSGIGYGPAWLVGALMGAIALAWALRAQAQPVAGQYTPEH